MKKCRNAFIRTPVRLVVLVAGSHDHMNTATPVRFASLAAPGPSWAGTWTRINHAKE